MKKQSQKNRPARGAKNTDRAAVILSLFREFPNNKFSLKHLASASGGATKEGRRETFEILGRLHDEGIDPVVARINMAFKTPLKSGDEFVSKLYLRKEGIKYVFHQDIFRLPDGKVSLRATVETVCLIDGRLSDSPLFDQLFAPYLHE
mgnify:CR=1 FL=1